MRAWGQMDIGDVIICIGRNDARVGAGNRAGMRPSASGGDDAQRIMNRLRESAGAMYTSPVAEIGANHESLEGISRAMYASPVAEIGAIVASSLEFRVI